MCLFCFFVFSSFRLLRDIYGAGYLNALSSLAEQSNQLRDMVNQSLFNDFHRNVVKRSPLCVWFKCMSGVFLARVR